MSTRRVVSVLLSVLVIGLLPLLGPGAAQACACGAYVPSEASDGGRVTGETALVTWDGATEIIDMSLQVQGSSDTAAWIMPVPQGARASLGRRGLFDDLEELTAPKQVTRYDYWGWGWTKGLRRALGMDEESGVEGGAPPRGAAGVRVDRQERIGPFAVTTLSGTDPAEVTRWLTARGYPAKPAIVPTIGGYLRQGWQVLAVRLVPAGGEQLGGDLDPLRLRFATRTPIYPIRLSQHARVPQSVRLYVAAPHRMELTRSPVSMPLAQDYAQWVHGSQIGMPDNKRVFLHEIGFTARPFELKSDLTFQRSARDQTYQPLDARVVDRSGRTAAAIGVPLVGLWIGLVLSGARRARRRSRARRPRPGHGG